jgi:transcriptional regulator CtsR
MSWIVHSLLTNRERIRGRSSLYEKEYRNFNFVVDVDTSVSDISNIMFDGVEDISIGVQKGYDDPMIEDDQFNDLIVVEKAIKELFEMGLISEYELKIIEMLEDGSFKKDVSRRLKIKRETLIKDFDVVCSRIAYYLGGYFTDDGFLSHMSERYRLTEEQIKKMKLYMRSRYRHKDMKKPLSTKGEI